MKLSTRTRYAMRAMLELAANRSNAPLQTKVIARDQCISAKYLEQLMSALKTNGLVRSIRGAKGGYVLAKAAEQIKLNDIFICLEGPVIITECIENEDSCSRTAECVTRGIWLQLQNAITEILESTTLQDLVDRARANEAEALDYQI